MNKRILPMSVAFFVLGTALIIIFRNSTPGTFGGILFIIAGIVALIGSRIRRT